MRSHAAVTRSLRVVQCTQCDGRDDTRLTTKSGRPHVGGTLAALRCHHGMDVAPTLLRILVLLCLQDGTLGCVDASQVDGLKFPPTANHGTEPHEDGARDDSATALWNIDLSETGCGFPSCFDLRIAGGDCEAMQSGGTCFYDALLRGLGAGDDDNSACVDCGSILGIENIGDAEDWCQVLYNDELPDPRCLPPRSGLTSLESEFLIADFRLFTTIQELPPAFEAWLKAGAQNGKLADIDEDFIRGCIGDIDGTWNGVTVAGASERCSFAVLESGGLVGQTTLYLWGNRDLAGRRCRCRLLDAPVLISELRRRILFGGDPSSRSWSHTRNGCECSSLLQNSPE